MCDTFSGVVKSGDADLHYNNGEHSDTKVEIVEDLLDLLNISNAKILKGIFPDDTEKLIEDDKFRFVHIDVDVYQSAKDILEFIWGKVVKGGCIVFDDYGFESCTGIEKLVEEHINDQDKIFVHNLNGHAIFIKLY